MHEESQSLAQSSLCFKESKKGVLRLGIVLSRSELLSVHDSLLCGFWFRAVVDFESSDVSCFYSCCEMLSAYLFN